MKPHSVSGDGSLGNESGITIGEKFRRVYEAAVMAMTTDSLEQRRIVMSKQSERRHRANEPIRTMMFLGSWSHT
ncbi:hypothetical protein L6164_034667 [Bauhinia variegata]|uniref:Uncharacterized protein n=1 Tax=Bauhinia variegata TaxID=167791 RepID=A0ACB9KVV0_BAUVA|nr:hypothetical protein L6164_034667 [Bauhinia variegata]